MLVRLLMVAAVLRSVQLQLTSLEKTTVAVLLRDFRDPFAPALISQAASSPEEDQRLTDVLEKVIVQLNGSIAIQFNRPSEHQLRRPYIHNVLFVGSYEAFKTLYDGLTVVRYDFSGRYLVVYNGLADEDFARRLFQDLWILQIINVMVVGRGDNGTQLWSYLPYAMGSCASTNLVSLDMTDEFYPDKTTTFHGCPFRVGSFETRPYTIMDRSDVNNLKMSGFEGDLLDTLKEKLNFTIQIYEPPHNEQWGYALKQNSTGMMRMIQEGEVDFGISCLGISVARSCILKAGIAHYTTSLVLAVPKGRPYTAFEKLFRPFEANIWWIIATIVMGAAFIIASIEFRNRAVRNFVYGQQIHTPYLNLVQVFFGIGMPHLPTRNFARTLLFLWIYFCFVLRSLYQGALFRYLQQESTFPPSRTMNEIDQTGAVYYVIESGERYYEAFPGRLLRLRHLPQEANNIINRLAWMIRHPESPDVVQGGLDHMAHHNRLYGRKGGAVNICPEFISTFTIAIYYPKKSMLTEQFNTQILRIQASGLMSYWINRYGDYKFNRAEPNVGPEPRQLSNEHLSVIYEMCGAILGCSLFVFGLELASNKVRWMKHALDRLSGMGDFRE